MPITPPRKPLSKNPLYEPCTNSDCVGGRDVDLSETCETCDGHEFSRRVGDCMKCGEECDIEEALCGDCESLSDVREDNERTLAKWRGRVPFLGRVTVIR